MDNGNRRIQEGSTTRKWVLRETSSRSHRAKSVQATSGPAGAFGIVSGTAVGTRTGMLHVNTPEATVAQFAGVGASLLVIGILAIASSRRTSRSMPSRRSLTDDVSEDS